MLKRVLPFALALAVGLLLVSFAQGFLSLMPSFAQRSQLTLKKRTPRYSCRSAYSRHNLPDSSHVIVTFKPLARYTPEARRQLVTGTVRLRVLYGADGSVLDAMPLTTLPYGLTEEAISAAKRTQFIPAKIYGEPYSEWRIEDFEFGLN